MPGPIKIQQKAATMALAAKRGQRPSHNLSPLQKQLYEQLSENELRNIVMGKVKTLVELKPLARKKRTPKHKPLMMPKPVEEKPVKVKRSYKKSTTKKDDEDASDK